ncbi:hypothetical protein KM031_15120 [Gemmobacter fulvus]|uniref:Nickel/cobalt efflux system n=1 Tax=Gemmobacter fulvus TaxID=2840474 RepID=A0A975S0H5_9RHOB|nr:hypothetical protein [Gemmobacter fulvus]MBT9247382.1 hypothetical protein [Gemmobacter fulvus]QWK90139.1 hypothetical protein KM031_15120 [Gemmobacter fulvus]
MRRLILSAGLLVALVLALLWLTGGLVSLRLWAEAAQRDVQRDMAAAVRAIAGRVPGAVFGLLAVSFAYGFFHAVGPGHGKMLIGGYGMARRVRLGRLAVLALVSSLAQSSVAVALVYAFILGLGWARDRVQGLSDAVLLPLSHAAIAGIGIWLVWRGIRGLRARAAAGQPDHAAGHHHHHHDHHHHDHHDTCGCGHAHGPTLAEAEAVTGWRDGLALIAGVALRPCSGALFLLIVSWQMGIALAGIAGVYAMGLGTALVTVAVAALAVWAREGTLTHLPGAGLARALPLLELVVGALIALIAGQMFLQSL